MSYVSHTSEEEVEAPGAHMTRLRLVTRLISDATALQFRAAQLCAPLPPVACPQPAWPLHTLFLSLLTIM